MFGSDVMKTVSAFSNFVLAYRNLTTVGRFAPRNVPGISDIISYFDLYRGSYSSGSVTFFDGLSGGGRGMPNGATMRAL